MTPEEKKEKEEKEKEEKLKELEKIKAEIEAKKKAAEDKKKLEKKQENIRKMNDEIADRDQRVKTANEKKEFWKAKAAAIKNATEMEKEEAEQDEKDYQEMKKAIPGVVDRVIKKVKGDIKKDKKEQDDRIKLWNRRLMTAHPIRRTTPEPEKAKDEKADEHVESDAAVAEKKSDEQD